VFSASLSDVFDNAAPPSWRRDLFDVIEHTPNLDWLLLTKRIGNVEKMVPEKWFGDRWPRNVWLGATVVNQEEADRDIPKLLALPARMRFLSIEPMLGPIDFYATSAAMGKTPAGHPWANGPILQGIHWIIAGGESGGNCRPAELEWFRSLQRQSQAAGVAFFMKQLGGHPDKHEELEQLPEDLRMRQWPEGA